MDYLNLPLYVWILAISIIVILITISVFIMKRRAKEARELDAMFEPAWDEEAEGLDRETIQRRRREMRSRRQKEYESRIDRGIKSEKKQEENEESEHFPADSSEQELHHNVKEGFSSEDQDEKSEQKEPKPLYSSSAERKMLTNEETEQEKLKQDPSLDRLGSLPPLGRWQEEKSSIGKRTTLEQTQMEPGSLPPRGKKSTDLEEAIQPESPKEMHSKDSERHDLTRGAIQGTGFRRLGDLPPLDTSRFQHKKEADSEPKDEHDLVGNTTESLYRPFSKEESKDGASLEEKELQSFDEGLPLRGLSRLDPKATEAKSGVESKEEKRYLRRSTFYRDIKAEETREKQEEALALKEGLEPRRASHSLLQGTEETQETMKQQEVEENKPKRILRRSQAFKTKETGESSILKESTSFDSNLASEGDFQESEGPIEARMEPKGEESGLRRRYLKRSARNEEIEKPASDEGDVSVEEKLPSRSVFHLESYDTRELLGTREQRETIADHQPKRILRRSSTLRQGEMITSSKQEEKIDSFGDHSFPLRRSAKKEFQQEEIQETSHSSERLLDLEEKQEPSYPNIGQGLGPRSQRQKSRWKMPWSKK